jgi:hypothetical protein
MRPAPKMGARGFSHTRARLPLRLILCSSVKEGEADEATGGTGTSLKEKPGCFEFPGRCLVEIKNKNTIRGDFDAGEHQDANIIVTGVS